MIWTTTNGAKYSVRPIRQIRYGTVKMIAIAIRKISVVFTHAQKSNGRELSKFGVAANEWLVFLPSGIQSA